MKQEFIYFCNALSYFSRIPVSRELDYSETNLSRAFRYLPLVGILAASLSGLFFVLLSLVFPKAIAVLGMLSLMLLLTGCMHEDGFCDFCDGFGAGTSQEHILRIMKDSHIGVYGVLGLIVIFAMKFFAFMTIPTPYIPMVFIAAHAISRAYAVAMVRFSRYARKEESKSQHTRLGVDLKTFAMSVTIGLVPLLFLPFGSCLWYLPFSCVLFLLFRAYLHKKINGFTGDTLGALQQLTETLFYLVFVASHASFVS